MTTIRKIDPDTKAAQLLDDDCRQAFSFGDYGVYGPVPPAPYFIVGLKHCERVNFKIAFIVPTLNAVEGVLIQRYLAGRNIPKFEEWEGKHWLTLIKHYQSYGYQVLVERTWRYKALGVAVPGQPVY